MLDSNRTILYELLKGEGMDFPSQVNMHELKQRIITLLTAVDAALNVPNHYVLLPRIKEFMEIMCRMLSEGSHELEILDDYAAAAGRYVVLDEGMPFSDTPLGSNICSLTGDIHQMFWTQSAIEKINIIINKEHHNIVAKDIYHILIDIRDHFAADGKKDYNYLHQKKDILREIRSTYGSKLGPEYQEIFQILMG